MTVMRSTVIMATRNKKITLFNIILHYLHYSFKNKGSLSSHRYYSHYLSAYAITPASEDQIMFLDFPRL